MRLLILTLLIAGCAQPRIVRHDDGVFEDTVDGVCFRYAAVGGQAWVVRAQCPGEKGASK
jgi:hypothetical protein